MRIKTLSSQEKVFLDAELSDYPETGRLSALRGERVSFQVAFEGDPVPSRSARAYATIALSGDLAPLAQVRNVKNVPVEHPVFLEKTDDNYLRKTPGLYPDLLLPMSCVGADAPHGKVRLAPRLLRALWVDLRIPEDYPAGEHSVTVSFVRDDGETVFATFAVEVIPAALPKQELLFTHWFHCDALAQYYRVPVWSDEHFRLIGNFARTARENGVNMLLVPTFTPPLDTAIGGERLTTQLVSVRREGGEYVFGFDLLDRYLDTIRSAGIEYYEIAHLYSQWGAEHAPKILAEENGEQKRIFGWETDAHGEEYTRFLRAFLQAFLAHMRARGEDKKCFFHFSDEPQPAQIDRYRRCKEAVGNLLAGYPVMDALSDFSFYEQGVVQTPIPSSDHIGPFLAAGVPGLWTYYCCGQSVGVSNRLIAMPSWRTRALGMQMFCHNVVGFLQWGYNFYNNCYSYDAINPYSDLSGEFWVPAGDTFSVYPAPNGEALESLRLLVFCEGIADLRAMRLCELLCGREATVRAIEEAYGGPIVFDDCPRTGAQMLRVRETVNRMIAAACS